MALIKSKQIKDLAAIKVVETTEKRFVSDTEKGVYADKYTKTEIDTTITNTLTTASTDAKGKADQALVDAKTYADGVQTALSTQITNAIAGLTWKTPVATFADIVTTYPTPSEGWMVTVDDTNKVFRYDSTTTSWVEFPIQSQTSYTKSISLTVTDGQTVINTGIRNDGTGVNKTSREEIILSVNGFTQQAGALKDYTVAFVTNELVITWFNRDFTLEATDEIIVSYNHFEVV